jgi:hypothetical protein
MEEMSLELETSSKHCEIVRKAVRGNERGAFGIGCEDANLESSLTELQDVLAMVQSRSEKKA